MPRLSKAIYKIIKVNLVPEASDTVSATLNSRVKLKGKYEFGWSVQIINGY